MMQKKVFRWMSRLKNGLLKKPAVALILNTARQLGRDDAPDMAACISYYSVLSIFPLLLGAISLLGFFLSSETSQRDIIHFVEMNLPVSVDLVKNNIAYIIELRGTIGIVSLLALFWSGSAIFGAIGRVMNRIWRIEKKRPFYITKSRDLALALSSGILFFVSLGFAGLSSVTVMANFPNMGLPAIVTGRIISFSMIFIVFLLIYRYMPNFKTPWRYLWLGAFVAAILFEVIKSLFVYYLEEYADYELVYGSLASIIVLLVWIYLSACILILGAEFSSEYSRMYGSFTSLPKKS